ncbi:hypothetical protein ARMGADRAFT_1083304 [Armillaria gallica]|uniref:Uncharacterized protein n=1 Tax=Armillaria gallica TaxID=47427 RepID=A0A2H3DL77_ARMGA|nr:hypothetical protein ARMGADRAFT_1083304 [Armillaria gallica]
MQQVARESDLSREFGPKACTERALQLGAYWVTEGNQGTYPSLTRRPYTSNSHPELSVFNTDRTVLSTADENAVQVEKLPPETTQHFDRDPETNKLLWFASPPMNVTPAPTPRYSLAYLHFLSTKRRKRLGVGKE